MVRTFCTMLVVRPQLAYCTDTSAKLGPLISDTPLEVDYCPSREASYTNANAQHLHRPWNFGSLEAAPHPRTHVAACLPAVSSLLLRDNLDLESATFEVRRCPRHARARIVPRACFFRIFDHPGADERLLNWDETHSGLCGLRVGIGLVRSAVCSENQRRESARRKGDDVRWRI